MTPTNHSTRHALLDAARMGAHMAHARSMNQKNISLYKGDSERDLAEFAPYIFSLTSGDEFSRWLLDAGWEDRGVFLQTTAPGKDLVTSFTSS